MSETIGEMILPGTYIEVRSEGLISVGGIATGNVGVVGTANRGPINERRILGSLSEALDTFGVAGAWPGTDAAPALTLTRTIEQIFKGGASTVYAVRVANGSPASTSWTLTRKDGATDKNVIDLTATTPGSWANDIVVALTPADSPTQLEISYKRSPTSPTLKESYPLGKASDMVAGLASSQLVTAALSAAGEANNTPDKISAPSNGTNGGVATATEINAGLDKLLAEPVNIVTVGSPAGKNAFDAKTIGAALLAHLEASENEGRERIAVLGAWDDDPTKISGDDVKSNPRLVIVAPGIMTDDGVKLPAPYSAALVAGRLAGLAPHVSLTNKDVAAAALTRNYTRAEQKNLLGKQLLVIVPNLGVRVLKGITSDTGAFRQVSVRRVVDYAKAGVRIGSNPYIGKLNNPRVRAALKATLDGFLSGMVLDEMLTAYELDVTATRAQEIAGQAIVTMLLQPTFSIDFVKVIMNLG